MGPLGTEEVDPITGLPQEGLCGTGWPRMAGSTLAAGKSLPAPDTPADVETPGLTPRQGPGDASSLSLHHQQADRFVRVSGDSLRPHPGPVLSPCSWRDVFSGRGCPRWQGSPGLQGASRLALRLGCLTSLLPDRQGTAKVCMWPTQVTGASGWDTSGAPALLPLLLCGSLQGHWVPTRTGGEGI